MFKKFMAKYFVTDNFKKYSKSRIKGMMVFPIYFGLTNILFYIIMFITDGAGYFVNIKNIVVTNNIVHTDRTKYEFIPINSIFEQLIFGTNTFDYGSHLFSTNLFDVIAVSILLFMVRKFLISSFTYNPFSSEAVSSIRKLATTCYFIFISKMIFNIILLQYYRTYYPSAPLLNIALFTNWMLPGLLATFLLNIFLYGNQIKTDNDLAI